MASLRSSFPPFTHFFNSSLSHTCTLLSPCSSLSFSLSWLSLHLSFEHISSSPSLRGCCSCFPSSHLCLVYHRFLSLFPPPLSRERIDAAVERAHLCSTFCQLYVVYLFSFCPLIFSWVSARPPLRPPTTLVALCTNSMANTEGYSLHLVLCSDHMSMNYRNLRFKMDMELQHHL